MEKQNNITTNVCFEFYFFILLGKKTPKMHAKYPIYGMEIIVYYEYFSPS